MGTATRVFDDRINDGASRQTRVVVCVLGECVRLFGSFPMVRFSKCGGNDGFWWVNGCMKVLSNI